MTSTIFTEVVKSNPECISNEVWVDIPIDTQRKQDFEGVPVTMANTEPVDKARLVHIKKEVDDSVNSDNGWYDHYSGIEETNNQPQNIKSEDISSQNYEKSVSKVGLHIKQETFDVGGCSYSEETSDQMCSSESAVKSDEQLLNSLRLEFLTNFSTEQTKATKKPKQTAIYDNEFCCNVCDQTFPSSVLLRKHKTTHKKAKKARKVLVAGEKPFGCDECNFKSAHMSSLKKHKMSHTGERPFECDQCDFKCTESSNLNRHKMNHSGEKPFKCDRCQFKTINSSHLKRHIRLHTGEKPFVCDQCDYKSANSSHLKTHYMLHTGEKPFKCDQCDFKSRNSSHLKRHIKCHTRKSLKN